MKKTICLIVCIILIVSLFAGCNQTATPTGTLATEKPTETVPVPTYTPEILKDEVLYDGELYKLERIDGQCYIIIKDQEALMTENELRGSLQGNSNSSRMTQIALPYHLTFSSFTEFVKTVTVSGLSLEQLSLLNYNHRSSDGKIRVCEFDRIHYPALPEGFEFSTIMWYGEYYECYVRFYYVSSKVMTMALHTENSYLQKVNRLEEMLERDELTKNVDEENPDMIIYTNAVSGCLSDVVYKVVKNDILYTVHEEYQIESSTTPYRITAYGEGNNVLFTYEAYTSGIRTDRDWITEFSVQLGIPN